MRPRSSYDVKGHEQQQQPQQPIEGALDRLASFAQAKAAEAGFSKSPATARGIEMGDAPWQARSGKDEAVAVYHWPRGIVRIGVQSRHVEVERLP